MLGLVVASKCMTVSLYNPQAEAMFGRSVAVNAEVGDIEQMSSLTDFFVAVCLLCPLPGKKNRRALGIELGRCGKQRE